MIRFPINFEPPVCGVDPVTLTGLVLGGLAGGGAALAAGGGGAGPSAPGAPPPIAAPQQSPTGTRAQPKSQQPTFVGATSVPNNTSGQKTLLGQ